MKQPDDLTRCNVFELEQESVVAHDGIGEVLFRRIASTETVRGACNFIDFTRIPPGASIGVHRHALDNEEYYLIMSGTGLMTCEDESFSVKSGDLVRNPPGGQHGLINDSETELSLFVFELQVQS